MKSRSMQLWNKHANGCVTPKAVTTLANKTEENKLRKYLFLYLYILMASLSPFVAQIIERQLFG
jgi:hypothetical protein